MNLIVAVISFLFMTITSAKAVHKNNNNKCSRQLAGIMYNPDVYNYAYFQKLERQFRVFSDALFTSNNASYVFKFEQTYDIGVTISDPIGFEWKYILPSTVIYDVATNKYQDTARSVMNIPGYNFDTNTQTWYYTFHVWNDDAELLIVTFKNFVGTPTVDN